MNGESWPALAPALGLTVAGALFWLMYLDVKDALRPEPRRMLLAAVALGCVASAIAFLVYRLLEGLVNDSADSRQRLLSSDEGALLLWPGPLQEYHGRAIAQAPTLESLFGPDTTVTLQGARVELARNRSYAWVVARLKARTLVNDEIVEVPLRGSYVFRRERDQTGTWTQMQGHVSAPVDPASLARRVFGLELPELSGDSDR